MTISADILEKIAAINHLAIAEVIRLFLTEALSEGEWDMTTAPRAASCNF